MARIFRLAALRLLIGGCAALVPPSATNQYAPGSMRHQRAPGSTLHQRSPGRRRRRIYASPEIEDRLALGGDVAVLFLYSYTQKSLDTIYAVTANYVEGIEVDEMDCFRDPSFAAAALSLAWLCGALPQGAFRFEVNGVVGGRPVLVAEHVTRIDDGCAPDWPQSSVDGGLHRVVITGRPNLTVSVHGEDASDPGAAAGGNTLAANRIVNAIPAVCEGEPGPVHPLALPPIVGSSQLRLP